MNKGGRPEGAKADKDEAGLTAREREVLSLAAGKDKKKRGLQSEIARELGLTRQQVGQIVSRLKEKGLW